MNAQNPKDAYAQTVGRVPLGLFPATAIVAGAMGMLEGNLKYGLGNYRVAAIEASTYIDALMRHLLAYQCGETIDPDSGLPHTWKMMSCLAVLLDAEATGMLIDNRPPAAPVAKMLEDLKPKVREIHERYGSIKPRHYTIQDKPI